MTGASGTDRRGLDTAADLVLYLEHGVSFPRHRDIQGRGWLGALLLDTAAGAEVAEVAPGEFADQAGLQPGDVIVQLGRGAVFGNAEVAFFLREHDPGEEVEVVWAREGDVHRGRGRLTPRDELLFVHRA